MIDFLIYVGLSFGFLTLGAVAAALFITVEVGKGENDNDRWYYYRFNRVYFNTNIRMVSFKKGKIICVKL